MKLRTLAFALVMASVALCQNNPPAKPAAAPGSGITREQADAILNELKQIRLLLEKQQQAVPSPPPAPVPLRGKVTVSHDDLAMGDPKAPLTMVEFTDYQCPFCKDFHKNVFPQLKKDFIDTGKVRFVTRDMPLDFHQNAEIAAEAARCANEQNKFWPMRELIFSNSPRIAEPELKEFAADLGLNKELFQSCLATHKYEVDVRLNLAQAGSLKISGTPSFLLGPTSAEGVEGDIVEGSLPFDVFSNKLKSLLPADTK